MRVVCFIFLILLSTLLPLWLWLSLALLYAYFWCGVELLVIAVLLDAYFGVSSIPLYTVCVGVGLLLLEWLKPRLLVYNEPT